MTGLQKILKLYGKINITGADGKRVNWIWDYKNDKPMIESEMTQEQIMESEKAKWGEFKTQLQNNK